MRNLVLCALAACAVSAGVARGAPGQAYAYDRLLGIAARTSLWQAASQDARISMKEVLRVYVRCYRDKGAFERTFERRFGESARRVVAYYVGGGDVHLRNGTCDNARTFLGGRHTVYTAGAYAIVLHEALHRQGVSNERITTCLANEAVRWGTLWHGFGEAQALRARNLAFAYTRLFSPPGYYMASPTASRSRAARTGKRSRSGVVEAALDERLDRCSSSHVPCAARARSPWLAVSRGKDDADSDTNSSDTEHKGGVNALG